MISKPSRFFLIPTPSTQQENLRCFRVPTSIMFQKAFIVTFAAIFILSAAVEEEFELDTTDRMRPVCGGNCLFRLCKAVPGNPLAPIGRKVLLRDRDVATYPLVCRPGFGDLGNIISTHEALVRPGRSSGAFVRISQYKSGIVRPSFKKNYFKLSEINAFPPIPGKYGLARGKSKGNQEANVDDLCVKIPIKAYKRGSSTIRTNNANDCVSLTTVVPIILVELTWDAGDDLDLTVFEPSGNRLYFGNKNSPSTGGRLLEDTNVGLCGTKAFGREQVRWLVGSSPLKGRYRVQVRHYSACGGSFVKPKWSLSIIINGKLKITDSGESNLSDDAVIVEKRFRIK